MDSRGDNPPPPALAQSNIVSPTTSDLAAAAAACRSGRSHFDCESGSKKRKASADGDGPSKSSETLICEWKSCGSGFRAIAELGSHVEKHIKSQSSLNSYGFRCEWKGCKVNRKSFRDSWNLIVHVRYKHTGERPWSCPCCGKSFVEPHLMRKHTIALHMMNGKDSEIGAPTIFQAGGDAQLRVRSNTELAADIEMPTLVHSNPSSPRGQSSGAPAPAIAANSVAESPPGSPQSCPEASRCHSVDECSSCSSCCSYTECKDPPCTEQHTTKPCGSSNSVCSDTACAEASCSEAACAEASCAEADCPEAHCSKACADAACPEPVCTKATCADPPAAKNCCANTNESCSKCCCTGPSCTTTSGPCSESTKKQKRSVLNISDGRVLPIPLPPALPFAIAKSATAPCNSTQKHLVSPPASAVPFATKKSSTGSFSVRIYPKNSSSGPAPTSLVNSGPTPSHHSSTESLNATLSTGTVALAGKCEWRDCGSGYEKSDGLGDHIFELHIKSQKARNRSQKTHGFVCEWKNCDRQKPFNSSYQLQHHIRFLHTGERPFSCPNCGSAFAQVYDLRHHQQKIHALTSTPNPNSNPISSINSTTASEATAVSSVPNLPTLAPSSHSHSTSSKVQPPILNNSSISARPVSPSGELITSSSSKFSQADSSALMHIPPPPLPPQLFSFSPVSLPPIPLATTTSTSASPLPDTASVTPLHILAQSAAIISKSEQQQQHHQQHLPGTESDSSQN